MAAKQFLVNRWRQCEVAPLAVEGERHPNEEEWLHPRDQREGEGQENLEADEHTVNTLEGVVVNQEGPGEAQATENGGECADQREELLVVNVLGSEGFVRANDVGAEEDGQKVHREDCQELLGAQVLENAAELFRFKLR